MALTARSDCECNEQFTGYHCYIVFPGYGIKVICYINF